MKVPANHIEKARAADLTRRWLIEKLRALKLYQSSLTVHLSTLAVQDALDSMDGVRGQQVITRIVNFALNELGYGCSESPTPNGTHPDSKTLREARRLIGKGI